MAITSGVRQLQAYMQIGGASLLVEEADARCTSTKESDTFWATIPFQTVERSLGLAYFASQSPIDGALTIMGQTLVSGSVDRIDFRFNEQRICIEGRDRSAALHDKKSHEQFKNQTASDVVQTVAQRHGLQVDMDTTKGNVGRIVQIDWNKLTDGLSDWSLLMRMAEYEGAKVWVAGGTLHFKTQDSGSVYTANYRPWNPMSPAAGDFIHLAINRNVQLSKSVEVNVGSWNSRKKKAITSKKTMSGGGSDTPLVYDYRLPGLTQDQADKIAEKKANEHARHELVVDCQMVGDPSIDPSMKFRLSGTGTELDQDYVIDSIDHHIGAQGYVMEVNARNHAQNRSVS